MNESQNTNVVNSTVTPNVQSPSVNPNTISTQAPAVPVQSTQPQPMPVQSTPVQSQPVQASPVQSTPVQAVPTQSVPVQNTVSPVTQTSTVPVQSAPVQPVPVQTQSQPVQPQQVPSQPVQSAPVAPQNESPFFTPVSVSPEVQSSPVLPEIKPVVKAPVTSAAEETIENAPQLEVIETAPKSKAGNFIIIMIAILLIVFVFNIDTVISLYDQYRNVNSPSNPNNSTNNLTDGYILINESTSSIKVKDIKFYNFRKSQGKGITFSYEVLSKHEDAKSLEIYVELYNSEKEIIYKELFNPNQKLEKNTVRTYTIDVTNNIYDDAFYALVKNYTEEEKKSTSVLTCISNDKDYSYKYIFNFLNNGLNTYEVEKNAKNENDERLIKEYDDLKNTHIATLENNTLKYKVDLNTDNGELIPLYEKDTTLKIIKDKQTLKEWICE